MSKTMADLDNKTIINLLIEHTKLQHPSSATETKAYKRRWFILTIFIIYGAVNAYQWVEYSIITNIITRYYNVSPVTVDWTSIIYMAVYPILVIPGTFILEQKGLHMAGLIGALGTAVGTFVKVFSIGQNTFWLVLLGQTILSISQILILCLPPRLAVVWFKENEISTVCSLGVFGTQLGVAIGYVLTPILVQNHENVGDMVPGIKMLNWGLAAFAVPSALVVLFYFPNAPPQPPNVAQVEERNNQIKFSTKLFFKSLKNLMLNKAFAIHVLAYGINVGVFSAFGTLLNQFVLDYFPNSAEDAGRMGLVMIVVGMIGSILFGIFLDKTHKYKETTFFIYLMSAVSVAAFMLALEMKSKILVYITIGSVGLFINAYVPVGFEMAMELTYPAPEGTTTGFVMAPSQFLGVIFALASGKLMTVVGTFWAIGILAILLAFGTIITALVPNQLRRQEAFRNRANGIIPLKIINEKI